MSYYSPFTYKPNCPFYIPPFNNNTCDSYTPNEYIEPPPAPAQYDGYDYLLAECELPHPNLNLTIHPNSAAAQLGLTPEELAPILKEQQEFLDTVSYEPKQYKHPLAECAQPLLHNLDIIIHPNSAAAQLELTTEKIAEVLEDQEQWMREAEVHTSMPTHTTYLEPE
jgi:hypothetical protein